MGFYYSVYYYFAIPFNVFDVFYDEFNLYLIMLIGCGLLYALLFVNYD